MKVIVVGGTGTIGRKVVEEISQNHEVIIVARNKGDIQADIMDLESIKSMYKKIGKFDALISATGRVAFGALTELTPEDYLMGLRNKLMGQVNLVLLGIPLINDAGSFTLTSGILSDDPIWYGTSAAMVNGGINAFVKGAAIEMPRHIRINAISPTLLTESLAQLGDYFKGFETVCGERVARAYRKSIDGAQTGQVYRVW